MLSTDTVAAEAMNRGLLITIEGLDGAGKTTLATALGDALGERSIDLRLLREPGGVHAAERIRELVTDPRVDIGPRAEALLYAAARAQLVQEAIEPLLRSGTSVLLDRFIDSSLAYQGGGRELGVGAVRRINEFATGHLQPDRTLLLVVDPAVGLSRSQARGAPLDRLEREDDAFRQRIASVYAELAAAEPDRIRLIDAAKPPDDVLAAALRELSDLI